MAMNDTTTDRAQMLLERWAAWLQGSGAAAAGYPTKSVLHPSWLPPASGMVPVMHTTPASNCRQERAVHAVVCGMSKTMQDTLVVVYVWRKSEAERAAALQCQPSTVRARVAQAKRQILGAVC